MNDLYQALVARGASQGTFKQCFIECIFGCDQRY